jgi:hypothetical protein
VQHQIQQYAQAPHIRLVGVVGLSGDDFGGHVRGSAAEGLDELALLDEDAEAEVDELDGLFVDEDVLGFDVAVGDVFLFHVLDGCDDLGEELFGSGLGDPLDKGGLDLRK